MSHLSLEIQDYSFAGKNIYLKCKEHVCDKGQYADGSVIKYVFQFI